MLTPSPGYHFQALKEMGNEPDIPPNELGAHVIGYVGAMSQGQEDRLLQWDTYLRTSRQIRH